MKLQLPNVTLVCVDGSVNELAKLAINDCLEAADFGDAIFASPEEHEISGVRCVKVDAWNPESFKTYSEFLWYEIPKMLRTSHFLVMQWDSWIINPKEWRVEWTDYDYIGAPWWYDDGMNVGNGGFSLRSARLANLIAERPDEFPLTEDGSGEDHSICRAYRSDLEKLGMVWAPENESAGRFSFECVMPWCNTFGFHGIFNFHKVLNAPRLRQRRELIKQNAFLNSEAQRWRLGH